MASTPQSRFACSCTNLRDELVQTGTGDVTIHALSQAALKTPTGDVGIPRQVGGWSDLGAFAIHDHPGSLGASTFGPSWGMNSTLARAVHGCVSKGPAGPSLPSNSYVFGENDPVNQSDPVGLTRYCFGVAMEVFETCSASTLGLGEWFCAVAAVLAYEVCEEFVFPGGPGVVGPHKT